MNNNEQYSLSPNLIRRSDKISIFSVKYEKSTIARRIRAKLDVDTAVFFGLIAGVLLHLLILFAALMAPVGAHAEVGEVRTWGSQGKAQFNVGSGNAEVLGIVPYRNGSMIVATACNAQASLDWCFTKLNVFGQVDTTWGTANSGSVIETTAAQDLLLGVVPTDNDGWFAFGSCAGIGCIIKYHASGARDSAFGVAGKRTLSDPRVTDMKVHPDGRITYSTECSVSFVPHACVGRLLPTSLADPTFNNGQQRVFAMGAVNANSGYTITSIAIDTTRGRTWVTGSCRENGKYEFCVARLTDDGRLDTAYASITGWFRFAVGGIEDQGHKILARPDGTAVIVGSCRADAADAFRTSFCAAQLVPWTAALDSGFGIAGTRMIDVVANGSNRIYKASAVLQEDGALGIFGDCQGTTGVQKACMALLAGNGSDDGRLRSVRAQIDLDNNENTSTALVGASSLVRESNLDFYVTVFGSCGSNGVGTPCLARLAWAYPRGGACNMDIDDDGKVLATTDGMILARIAAGMRGGAVVAGATNPVARRQTWETIRSYLVNDCGMSIAP
jgi:tetrahydromethanopterin S-methyltransferase subunit F